MLHWISRVLLPVLLFAADAMASDVIRLEYMGDLNQGATIVLSLEDQRPALRGSYFYKKWLKDISLKGEYVGDRRIALREYDAQGKVTGAFALNFANKDPRGNFDNASLDKEVLVGTWTSADGKRTYPAYFRLTGETRIKEGQTRYSVAGATDVSVVERNAQSFYTAVLSGNKQAAARYVSYPVSYNDRGERKRAATPAMFVGAYSRIFTQSFLARIGEGIPHNMFANANGIRLGKGEVWFDAEGKVFQLNN